MSKIHAAITAVNGYVPEYVLTNEELATMVDTNDEWIVSRTGIKERRIQKGEGLATSDLAVPAVEGLLKKRGIGADEIDLIIFCTTSPDMPFPATANILSHKIGAKNAWGIRPAGSMFRLSYSAWLPARSLSRTGKHTKVLVVGADKMSSMVDYEDRATCIIFGDGCRLCLCLNLIQKVTASLILFMKSDGAGIPHLPASKSRGFIKTRQPRN